MRSTAVEPVTVDPTPGRRIRTLPPPASPVPQFGTDTLHCTALHFVRDWKVSELESVRMHFSSKLESVRIGKCQNWKVSESESVRILKVSELESVRIGKCQNWKVSELESVRIGNCQNWKVSESESVRIGKRMLRYTLLG